MKLKVEFLSKPNFLFEEFTVENTSLEEAKYEMENKFEQRGLLGAFSIFNSEKSEGFLVPVGMELHDWFALTGRYHLREMQKANG